MTGRREGERTKEGELLGEEEEEKGEEKNMEGEGMEEDKGC